ncbi:MAG: hypothetical protein ACRD2L_09005, partial [Terriglobia bacterium]
SRARVPRRVSLVRPFLSSDSLTETENGKLAAQQLSRQTYHLMRARSNASPNIGLSRSMRRALGSIRPLC